MFFVLLGFRDLILNLKSNNSELTVFEFFGLFRFFGFSDFC